MKVTRVLLAVLALLVSCLNLSCSRQEPGGNQAQLTAGSARATVGPKITRGELMQVFWPKSVITGDNSYQAVNPNFKGDWHRLTGQLIFKMGGGGRWSPQFDCNRFVGVKLAAINLRYLTDTFHDSDPAEGPAAGEVWYIKSSDAPYASKGLHSTVVAVERDAFGKLIDVYYDIYTEQRIELTPEEKASIMLLKF